MNTQDIKASVLESLQAEVQQLHATNAAQAEQLAAKQAKIDALMLEFCPDEMGEDQLEEWARNQKPAPPEIAANYRNEKPLFAAQGAPEGWQPIETAPKDGTVIIALQCWIYHTDAARRPHYVLHEVFFNDDGGWEVVEDGEILDEDSLTHWLPRTRLPAAPEQAESKEK